MSSVETLLSRRLVLVTGKGGVGKSTVAAALAVAAQRRGRRTLLAEMGARAAMRSTLGGGSPGEDPLPLGRGLHGVLLDHDSGVRAYLAEHMRGSPVTRAILGHSIIRTFLRAAPSVTECVHLDRLRQFTVSGAYDLVVADLPAFGHAYQMLRAPVTIASMVRGGRISGPLEHLAEVLRDPQHTALVAVTLPEELPVSETVELGTRVVQDAGAPLSLVVMNQVLPPLLDGDSRLARVFSTLRQAARGAPTALAEPVALGALRAEAAERAGRLLHRLRTALDVAVLEIPLLTSASPGPTLTQAVAGLLLPEEAR